MAQGKPGLVRSFVHSFIHSFIQEFIRRPFKKSTQRRPGPTTAIQISLKQPAKRTFIIFRQKTDFQGESIPRGGTYNGECTTLPSCSLARGTNSWPVTEERRARRPGRPDTGLQSSQR